MATFNLFSLSGKSESKRPPTGQGQQRAQRSGSQSGGPEDPQRRNFLVKLCLAAGGIVSAAIGIPVIGALVAPAVRAPEHVWRPVGEVDDFPVGEISLVSIVDPDPLPWAGFAGQSAVWLRRENENEFTAFSVYCTHTGCPVRWVPGARLFLCPCHGGAFYSDGTVASGPPPAPLNRMPTRVVDGQVEVQTAPLPVASEG